MTSSNSNDDIRSLSLAELDAVAGGITSHTFQSGRTHVQFRVAAVVGVTFASGGGHPPVAIMCGRSGKGGCVETPLT